ncbi:MAG: alkene reductase [Rhizobiaceae bacterium]
MPNSQRSTGKGLLSPLFEPVAIGDLVLPNRIVLAPCTRNRATADLGPTPGAIEHYASRAEAGLLITEATLIAKHVQGYLDTPGMFLDSHVDGWAKVTEAVHERGGRIFLQLWHPGRMAHSHFTGVAPLAPSSVLDPAKRRQVGDFELYNEQPAEMGERQIADALAEYGRAARMAKLAEFDGVEIHAANGYLPEQFWRRHTNRRSDAWGGTAEKRARFMLETVAACANEIPVSQVGVRLSPAAYFSDMQYSEGDNEALDIILQRLAEAGTAYCHAGIVEDKSYPYLDGTSTQYLRQRWSGKLIGNGGYNPESAAAAIASKQFDLISFGKLFLANSDLVSRLENNRPLKPYSTDVIRAFT